MRDLIRAAEAGARSVGYRRGWKAEECEAAARERLVRQGCTTTLEAYRQGRWAAQDELRRLSRSRVSEARAEAAWPRDEHGEPIDFGADDLDLARADDRLLILDWADMQPPRIRRIVAHVLLGHTWQEAAAAEGISPSRVSQLMRRARKVA